jgi:hypothetical protein
MMDVRFVVSETRLTADNFAVVLGALADAGWRPALVESARAFLGCAGLPPVGAAGLARGARAGAEAGNIVAADIFFRDGDVVYVILKPRGRDRWVRAAGGVVALRPEIELGLIGRETESGEGDTANEDTLERLSRFTSTFQQAVEKSGMAAAAGPFDWRVDVPSTPRLQQLMERRTSEGKGVFVYPRISVVELQAVAALEKSLPRQILRDLSRASFARDRDLLFHGHRDPQQVRDALGTLRAGGVVATEQLLECRQTGHPLIRAVSREQIEATGSGGLLCPHCGGPFSEENIATVYSVSDLGAGLIEHSQWLRLWCTELLRRMQVPVSAIAWTASDPPNVSTMFADYFGRLWMFALADGDFTIGDAYAVNYQRVRYRADAACLIVTEPIASDVKRLLDDVGKEQSAATMLYCEGLDTAADVLRSEFARASLEYAHSRLAPLEDLAGFAMTPVLERYFAETQRALVAEGSAAVAEVIAMPSMAQR